MWVCLFLLHSYTANVNAIGVLAILDAIRLSKKK